MKVLMINGSPKSNGNTALGLAEMEKIFAKNGVNTEIIHVGHLDVRGCIGCAKCSETGKCVFDDIVNETLPKFEECDGMVIASPVYYASPNGTLISFLDRLFYAAHFDKRMKVGASVAVARRGGTTATYDVLNKYFTICGMPVASSSYWNILHGQKPGQAADDGEGMHTLRGLAENMTFLMKAIELGKEKYGLPESEPKVWTNFIR